MSGRQTASPLGFVTPRPVYYSKGQNGDELIKQQIYSSTILLEADTHYLYKAIVVNVYQKSAL